MSNLYDPKPLRRKFVRSSYPVVIAFIISAFIMLDTFYPDINTLMLKSRFARLAEAFPQFVSDGDKKFITYFIEWFGVLYGILLPLLLVRAWEQFDEIDREFDREVDTIKILSEDILLLAAANNKFKKKLLPSLMNYVSHVITNYKEEPFKSELRIIGDNILKEVRKDYYALVHQSTSKKDADALVQELLHQLNEIIDIRGDRISLSTQRLFDTLHFISLFASIIFIVPFYFIDLTVASDITVGNEFGIFGFLLIGSVTFLVIFILTLIDDLDEPFYGKWKLHPDSWLRFRDDIKSELRELGVVVVD